MNLIFLPSTLHPLTQDPPPGTTVYLLPKQMGPIQSALFSMGKYWQGTQVIDPKEEFTHWFTEILVTNEL